MEMVNHPSHYGGEENVYETIKIIEHHKLNFCKGNVLKYLLRAGKKYDDKELEDLEKALWYLQREVDNTKKEREHQELLKSLASMVVFDDNATYGGFSYASEDYIQNTVTLSGYAYEPNSSITITS